MAMTKFQFIVQWWCYLCYCLIHQVDGLARQKIGVIGASGGVGQQICSILNQNNSPVKVIAMSRNIKNLADQPLLQGCEKIGISTFANDVDDLAATIAGMDSLVISVGTSALPTASWKDNNSPKAACFDSVNNIMSALSQISVSMRPKKVVMVSATGVDKPNEIPFKFINACGILTEKKKAEDLLLVKAEELGFLPIICRPGRLVGPPYTNNDLTKLLKKERDKNSQGILIDVRDTIKGNVDRRDVAESICRLLLIESLPRSKIIYSIVNKAGKQPDEFEWGKLLSLFTIPEELLQTTRFTI